MRRPLLLTTTALALALTACRGGDGATPAAAPTPVTPRSTAAPDAGAPAAVAPGSSPAPQQVTDLADGVRRFGDGRALFASYDPAADRTVVATTIGIVVQVGTGTPQTISAERTTRFAASADGHLAAAITSAGHLVIWDLATRTARASFDVQAAQDTALTFAGPDAVLVADTASVVRYGADGTSAAIAAAPSGAQLGPVSVDDAGTVAVPVLTPTPTVTTWSPSAGPGQLALGLAAGTRLTGVVLAGDGAHAAVLTAPPSAGDQLRIFDVAAGTFTGSPV